VIDESEAVIRVNMHLHPPRKSVSTAVVLFQVCPILDSSRDLEVYRDGSYLEVVMRTILPFMFAAWIVMPTLSCVQVGKDSTLPAQLAPGVSQKPVLEASLAARGEMVLARVKSGTQHATHTDETRPRILTRA